MQHKKRMYKHLYVIYVIYFTALVIGFTANVMSSDFSQGFHEAAEEASNHAMRYYVLTAIDPQHASIPLEGLPQNVEPMVERLQLKVTLDADQEQANPFRIFANNGYAYLMLLFSILSSITIFVLFALIINSTRKSIRDEKPIHNRNIVRTRWIGGLFLLIEVSNVVMLYINRCEAQRLIEGTSLHVAEGLPINYWNIILGIFFIFMAEVFSIGSQLSEEQKLTI